MRSITKLLCVIALACTVSGCFWSEKQLSNKFTAAKPLPELNRFARFERQKDGEWKGTNSKYLVTRRKDGWVYKYSRIDDSDQKDGYFALIALQEPYFALESQRKGGFTYQFYNISADGIYGWTVFADIMKPIKDNPKLQQRLGVSCDDSKCWLSSISTLKNIMSYILSQNIPPNIMYKSISEYENAEGGTPKNITNAIRLNRKDCDLGSEPACELYRAKEQEKLAKEKLAKEKEKLAKMLDERAKLLWDSGKYQNARQDWTKACSLGLPKACSHLGEMLKRGIGGPKDVDMAKKKFHEACLAGYSYACSRQ